MGILLLIVLIFLEKWFMIFFRGVVLKNDMGECKIFLRRVWCRLCDVIFDLIVRYKDEMSVLVVCKKLRLL